MDEYIVKALDIIEDGLIIINQDYIIEYVNEPAKKLLRTDELIGKHSYEAIWGRSSMEGKSPSFMSFDTHEVASSERTFDDGTCLYVRSHPLDENHLVLTIWNVTDYVSLENLDVRRVAQDDPVGFLEKYPKGLIIDEVQRVPELLSYIQTIVDEKDKAGMFILTGSSQFMMMEKISMTGADHSTRRSCSGLWLKKKPISDLPLTGMPTG